MEIMQITELLSAYRNSAGGRNALIAISGRARSGKSTFSKNLSSELSRIGIPNLVYSGDWRFVRGSKDRESWIRSAYTGDLENYLSTTDQINWWDFDAIQADLSALIGGKGVSIDQFYDRATGVISNKKMALGPIENGIVIFENTILGKRDLLSMIDKAVFINLSDKDCLINALNTDGERRNPINVASRFLLTTFSENNFFRELFGEFIEKVIPVDQEGRLSSFPNFHTSTYVAVPVSRELTIDSIAMNGNVYLERNAKLHGAMNAKFTGPFFDTLGRVAETLRSNGTLDPNMVKPSGIIGIGKLPGDASNKAFFRLSTTEGDFILMLIDWRLGYGSGHSFMEVGEYLQTQGVNVPKILAWDSGKDFICMEDLGDVRLLELVHEGHGKETEKAYENVIAQLSRLRGVASTNLSEYNFATKRLTFEVLLWELDAFFRFFFEKHLQRTVSAEEKNEIYRFFDEIAKKISSLEQGIILRDVHSKNIMVSGNEPTFIDFQDAQIGPKDYDMASLLYDTYHPMSESDRKKHVGFYFDQNVKNGMAVERNEMEKNILLISIQRCLKGIGSFSGFETRKNDTRYLRYVGNFFQYATENLSRFPEYRNIGRILKKYYYL